MQSATDDLTMVGRVSWLFRQLLDMPILGFISATDATLSLLTKRY
jgi:hypothetical protein